MPTYEATLVARTPAASGQPTLVDIAPIRFMSLAWSDELEGPGRIDLSASVDDLTADAKARLVALDLYPCEIHVWRDGTRVAAGPITSWTLQSRTITMYAPGLLYYLEYMRVTADTTFTNQPQEEI